MSEQQLLQEITQEDLFPNKRRSSFFGKVCMCILAPFGILFYLIFVLIFFSMLFVTTITGIGPLIEYCLKRKDERILDLERLLLSHPECFLLNVPGDVNFASGGKPYKLFVRVTLPKEKTTKPPIIFPGGLAANFLTLCRHQDALAEEHGFVTVNFDRFGVGMSDENISGIPPTAADLAREMNFVMTHFMDLTSHSTSSPTPTLPSYLTEHQNFLSQIKEIHEITSDTEWISVGASMGAVVTESFMALYPHRLCGYLNLDGFPPGFVESQPKEYLTTNPAIYTNLFGGLNWTGFSRFLYSFMLGKWIRESFSSKAFGKEIIPLMCRKRFATNTAMEFRTMMSCADLVTTAWGKQASVNLPVQSRYYLCRLSPMRTTIVNDIKKTPAKNTENRSASELGETWLSPTSSSPPSQFLECLSSFKALAASSEEELDTRSTNCTWPVNPRTHPLGSSIGGIDLLPSNSLSTSPSSSSSSSPPRVYPLAPQFAQMAVRVMSARRYDLGDGSLGEMMYPQSARNHSTIHHNTCAFMARDGGRVVYPELSHAECFAQLTEVIILCNEIAESVRKFKAEQ